MKASLCLRQPVTGAAVQQRQPRHQQIGDQGLQTVAGADTPEEHADVGPLGQRQRRQPAELIDRDAVAARRDPFVLAASVGDDCRAEAAMERQCGQHRRLQGILKLRADEEEPRRSAGRREPGRSATAGHAEGRRRAAGVGIGGRHVEDLRLAPQHVGEPRPHPERGLPPGEAAEGAGAHLAAVGQPAQAHQRVVGQPVGGEEREPVARAEPVVRQVGGEVELQVAPSVVRHRTRRDARWHAQRGELAREDRQILGISGLVAGGLTEQHERPPTIRSARSVVRSLLPAGMRRDRTGREARPLRSARARRYGPR